VICRAVSPYRRSRTRSLHGQWLCVLRVGCFLKGCGHEASRLSAFQGILVVSGARVCLGTPAELVGVQVNERVRPAPHFPPLCYFIITPRFHVQYCGMCVCVCGCTGLLNLKPPTPSQPPYVHCFLSCVRVSCFHVSVLLLVPCVVLLLAPGPPNGERPSPRGRNVHHV
jgi:hypothetical protein